MPIRFRCAYCNQLMGIARRKAGQVVRCPNCGGQLVVPNPEEAGGEPQPPAGDEQQLVFERNDFEELLNPAVAGSPTATKPLGQPDAPGRSPPAPGPAVPDFDVEPVAAPGAASRAAQPGIILSPKMATILSVAVIVGLAVTFVLGLIVGKHL